MMKNKSGELWLDEVDGIGVDPPEDLQSLKDQIEHMRVKLKRPVVKDKEITKELLQWWWCWLHMRYHSIDKRTKNGKIIIKFFNEREKKYKEIYERSILQNS